MGNAKQTFKEKIATNLNLEQTSLVQLAQSSKSTYGRET